MTRSHRVPFLLLLLGLSSVAAAPGWATAGNPLEVATRPIFERNVGQADDEVRFLSRTPQAVMWITGDETVWSYRPSGDASRPWPTVRMRLVGARPDAPVVGAEPLETYVNDFRGGDPEKWHRRIPTFGRIVREQVYPGIDLQYRAVDGSVEYDFVCAPGADPGQIRFEFSGARTVGIDDGGDLVLNAGGERFVHEAPVAWQETPTGREPVEASFATRDGTVRFQVGDHDPELGLVIDPIVRYSSYLDGEDEVELGAKMAVHADGSAYVGINTLSRDLPMGYFPPSAYHDYTSYLAKVAPDGNTLVWATYLENHMARIGDLALDFAGGVYVVGAARDLGPPPVGDGVRCPVNKSEMFDDNTYVARFSGDGTTLFYATCFGGEDGRRVIPTSIVVDPAGEAIIGGWTNSTSLPGTTGRFQEVLGNLDDGEDGFVARFSPQGELRWATYLGGGVLDLLRDLTLDHSGSILVTGWTNSTDFPTTAGAWQRTPSERSDAFLSVLSGDGKGLLASTLLGGSWIDVGWRIEEGPEDRIYALLGINEFDDADELWFPTTSGAYQAASPNVRSAALVAFDFDLTTLEYSTFLHTGSNTSPADLALTSGAVLALVGANNCPGFSGEGPRVPWVISLDPTLSTRLDCFQYGAGVPLSLEVGVNSDLYLTGYTADGEIPVVNAFQPDYGGGDNDAFVARLDTYPYLASDGLFFFWNDLLGAGAYDLVCGNLGVLRVTGGDFGASELQCLGEDITSPVTIPDPAPGEGTWCLVRDVPLRGDGTWDVDAEGERDLFIDLSEGACQLNPACSHSLCAVAGPLDPECDPCVTQVCAIDPGCCDDLWSQECADLVAPVCGIVGCQNGSGQCEHSMCVTGAPLEPGCDVPPLSESCVETICNFDSDCCNPENAWDATCVDRVWTVCGLECDG